jgi:pimeloyl-ACP methyl ester carboxylesterase
MLTGWLANDLLVGDVRLHYCRTGHGDKPALVLVHGFSDSALCWSRTAHDLEAEYDVVMPDMRGHGLSERMRPGDDVDMAADLAGLILALGLERPIVGGHSMGAMVSCELGARFPDLARALVLDDPPWWLPAAGMEPGGPDADGMLQWARSLAGRTMDDLVDEYRREQPDWPDELVRVMAESKKRLDPGIVDTLIDRLKRGGLNWQEAFRGVGVPVLLVTGSPDLGAIVTPEIEARVRELNPRATIVNVPDVGHLIHYDNYPAFIDALRAFLDQEVATGRGLPD